MDSVTVVDQMIALLRQRGHAAYLKRSSTDVEHRTKAGRASRMGGETLCLVVWSCPHCVTADCRGRRYFATASAPICLPIAVPTSVEVR